MLRELRIRDFAIIDDLRIGFSPGLNVITGETGAGKSVILQALSLLCGGRAAPEMIRSDAESASIEGLFEGISDDERREALGLGAEDELLVRRVVARSGRGRVYLNGGPATVTILSQFGESLVHLYGQHDQALLLRPASQRDLLDAFAGHADLCARAAEAFSALASSRRRLAAASEEHARVSERRQSLAVEVEELAGAAVGGDEETLLRREREILRHAERLHDLSRGGEEALYSAEGAMVARLRRLAGQLAEAASIDPALDAPAGLIETARVHLEEAALQLRAYAEGIDVDPNRLETVENRLALLGRLSRRFATAVDELPRLLVRLQEELARLGEESEAVERARRSFESHREEALRIARDLSERRRRAAARLEREIRSELSVLGLADAVFRVRVATPAAAEAAEELGPSGFDSIEFFLSTNAGEEPKPLAQVASGGELSRVMLALKALTATSAETPILIFDEVDAGVGGGVADAVARRLKALAANRQLLCITHLPQIAAYADHHLAVEKRRQGSRTIARARPLGAEERIVEIGRMLGGTVAPAEAERYARRLVDQARSAAPGGKQAG
jgi:DNA repair protein RecN (Recombination protein N)